MTKQWAKLFNRSSFPESLDPENCLANSQTCRKAAPHPDSGK